MYERATFFEMACRIIVHSRGNYSVLSEGDIADLAVYIDGKNRTYIAIDLGGGSGRIMAGRLSSGAFALEEIHRFANYQIRIGNHMCWNFEHLKSEIIKGLTATPALNDADSLFISSGTWSLLGCCLESPVLTTKAHEGGFTNEGGVCGKICYLQNITGLWIMQSLMKEWNDSDYSQMISMR